MPSRIGGHRSELRAEAYEALHLTLQRNTVRQCDEFIEHAWEALSPTGVSWIGFYTYVPHENHLILGPCRDTPACSPIQLHGVCGSGITNAQTVIVDDVLDLGDAYVACDPRDRSEIVIPVGNPNPSLILDLDSREIASFGVADELWLKKCLLSCKMTPTEPQMPSSG